MREILSTIKMKKIQKYSMIAVLLIFGVTAFISCEKEDNLQTKNESQLNSKIGEYHNIALDLYYKDNKQRSSKINYKDVREKIIASLINYDSELFDKTQIKEYTLQLEKHLSNMNISFSNYSAKTTTNNFSKLINYLEQKDEISLILSQKLKNINSTFLSASERLVLINGLNDFNWNEQDKKYVSAFTQVYNSSFEYWTNAKKGTFSKSQADGDGVILADAAGALYGMLLGPISSVIQAALFSVIANNQ